MKYASIIPLMGADPCTHMGHVEDLGKLLLSLPGAKFVGLSAKAVSLDAKERLAIWDRQLCDDEVKTIIAQTAGETIRAAFAAISSGKHDRHLHIVVGHDRELYGLMLHQSVLDGAHDLPKRAFQEVTLHVAEPRSHNLSGTRMRVAALQGNLEVFKKHLGPMFSDQEAAALLDKVQKSLINGTAKVKRHK